MRYCIDTSALVDAWARYYPKDVFPGVWDKLEELAQEETLFACEEVKTEIAKVEDGLLAWTRPFEGFFHPIDEEVQAHVGEILGRFPRLIDSTKGRSLADPFVIALARKTGTTVVTGEKSRGTATKPRIPDVCEHFGIKSVNILSMFRELNWNFGR